MKAKRLMLCLFLSLALVVTFIPMTSFGTEDENVHLITINGAEVKSKTDEATGDVIYYAQLDHGIVYGMDYDEGLGSFYGVRGTNFHLYVQPDEGWYIKSVKGSWDGIEYGACPWEVVPKRYSFYVPNYLSCDHAYVSIEFENELVGAVLDRLGRDIPIVPDGEGHFTVTADVVVSPQFFAWVSGFGNQVKILSPESVVDQMREHADAVASMYH